MAQTIQRVDRGCRSSARRSAAATATVAVAVVRAVCVLCLVLACAARAEGDYPDFTLVRAFPNLKLNRPVWVGPSPDGTGRLFVVEQAGRILLLPASRTAAATNVFLDLSQRRLQVDNEEGLLGLAFHPKFRDDGQFYIHYSQQNPRRGVLSEFRVHTNGADAANIRSERVLLQVPQPYSNHNGGALAFGPDGFLYVSLGDGGAANDPHGFGQNLNTWLGKILRIDVDTRTASLPYGIPNDNPLAAQAGGVRPEIWAWGLRNVWRMAFDSETGELWAGDVGQNRWEEINVIVRGGNYGWNVREGRHAFDLRPPTSAPNAPGEFIDPVLEYPHTATAADAGKRAHGPGLSVTGGVVYRGRRFSDLVGSYLYADYQMGTIWALKREGGQLVRQGMLVPPNPARPISSFGTDAAGEVLIAAFDGYIHELAPRVP